MIQYAMVDSTGVVDDYRFKFRGAAETAAGRRNFAVAALTDTASRPLPKPMLVWLPHGHVSWPAPFPVMSYE